MLIKSENKNIVIKNFVDFLENNNLEIKENKLQLCYLFTQYCLSDLGIEEIEIEFVKEYKEKCGYYFLNTIFINERHLKQNIHIVLNTIAHELRHHSQLSLLRYKKIGFAPEIKFPIYYYDNMISAIIYDESGIFFPVYFTSITEKDARDYASFIVEKFLIDLKLKDYSFTNAWSNSMLVKNDQFSKKELKMHHDNMILLESNKQKIQNMAKFYLKTILAYSIDDSVPLPDNIIECYLKRQKLNTKSYALPYEILLHYYCDEEICKNIMETSYKLKDKCALRELINHENTKIYENDILKFLAFCFDKKPISFERAKEELYNYSDIDIKKIVFKYNTLLKDYKVQSSTEYQNLQKNLVFDEKTR